MNTTSPRRRITISVTAAAIALGSALAFGAPANAASESGGSLADIENSLVHVYTEYSGYIYYPTDDGWEWSEEVTAGSICTGWFASEEGHIATAGHCVQPEQGRRAILQKFLAEWDAEDLLADAITSWTVEGYEEGSEIERSVQVLQPDGADDPVIDDWTIAQVVDFQDFEDGDAALLKVAGISGVQPLTVSATTPEVGDEIVSIGFPGTVQQVVDVQRLGASFKTGTVSSRQVTDGGVPVTEVNAQVSGGMSGGPTIDADGDVIGINSFGILGEPQSFNFVTDTEALAQFLTSHGVDFEAATVATRGESGEETSTDGTTAEVVGAPAAGGASGTSSDAGPLLGIAIGGMIAVVLAGGIATVVIIIVAGRRRSRGAAVSAPQGSAPAEQHGPARVAPAPQPVYTAPAQVAPAPQPVYTAPAPQPAYTAPATVGYAAPAGAGYAAPVGFAAPPAPPLPPAPPQG